MAKRIVLVNQRGDELFWGYSLLASEASPSAQEEEERPATAKLKSGVFLRDPSRPRAESEEPTIETIATEAEEAA
jgi:hypothetical protein